MRKNMATKESKKIRQDNRMNIMKRNYLNFSVQATSLNLPDNHNKVYFTLLATFGERVYRD